jgi:hypothetical protein
VKGGVGQPSRSALLVADVRREGGGRNWGMKAYLWWTVRWGQGGCSPPFNWGTGGNTRAVGRNRWLSRLAGGCLHRYSLTSGLVMGLGR